MKKTILTSILAAFVCACAQASDGGIFYTETETMTNHVVFDFNTVSYAPAAPVVHPTPVAMPKPCPCKARVASSADLARPCPHNAGAPVRVKTYSEVIDHYQTYQPVVVYQPAGEVIERRVINAPKPCNRCNG